MTRWGLTLPLPNLPLRQHAELVRGAEAAGYTDLWSGETQGPDGFTPLHRSVYPAASAPRTSSACCRRGRFGSGSVRPQRVTN